MADDAAQAVLFDLDDPNIMGNTAQARLMARRGQQQDHDPAPGIRRLPAFPV